MNFELNRAPIPHPVVIREYKYNNYTISLLGIDTDINFKQVLCLPLQVDESDVDLVVVSQTSNKSTDNTL